MGFRIGLMMLVVVLENILGMEILDLIQYLMIKNSMKRMMDRIHKILINMLILKIILIVVRLFLLILLIT